MSDRLELNSFEFGVRSAAFLSLMNDRDFRRRFAADPGGVAARELQVTVGGQGVGTANRILSTLLENRAFVAWSERFQDEIERRHPILTEARSVAQLAESAATLAPEIQQEFARGVAEYLPAEFRAGLSPEQLVVDGRITAAEDDIAILLLVFIAIVVVVGVVRDDMLSRNTLRLLINQLDTIKRDVEHAA